MLFVCSVAWLFLLGASDWLERLVSEMTYNVLMGTLNPTHSLIHSLTRSRTRSSTSSDFNNKAVSETQSHYQGNEIEILMGHK